MEVWIYQGDLCSTGLQTTASPVSYLKWVAFKFCRTHHCFILIHCLESVGQMEIMSLVWHRMSPRTSLGKVNLINRFFSHFSKAISKSSSQLSNTHDIYEFKKISSRWGLHVCHSYTSLWNVKKCNHDFPEPKQASESQSKIFIDNGGIFMDIFIWFLLFS